MKAETL